MSHFGWIEKFDQAGDQDIAGKVGFIRSFLVEGYPPDQIINSPKDIIQLDLNAPNVGESLPLIGSNYSPAVVGILEQYAVVAVNKTTDGNTVTEVQARYSNDRRWRGAQQVDSFETNRTRPTFRRETIRTSIPYGRKGVSKTIQEISGVKTTAFRDRWEIKEKAVEHKAFALVVTVTIQGWPEQLTHGQIRSINEEAGNLHYVNAQWQQFSAGDAIPLDDENRSYEMEYTWTADPGTITLGAGTGTLDFPGQVWTIDPQTGFLGGGHLGNPAPGADLFVRPPFHELIGFLQTDLAGNATAEIPPDYDAVPLYRKIDRDGWSNLPGLDAG